MPTIENPKAEILPLSISQYQVWLDQKLYPNSSHLTTGGMGFINGPLDISLFHETVAELVKENDALRLLPLPDGTQQVINDWQETLLEFHDFSQCDDSEKTIEAWWKKTYAENIPLDGKQRPWRIYLLRSTHERYGIVMKYHHIMIDGYSTALAMNGMSYIYSRLDKQRQAKISDNSKSEASPPEAPVQFRQFIEESIAYQSSKAIKLDQAYWHKIFPTLPEHLFEPRHSDENKAVNQLPKAHHHHQFMPIEEYCYLQQFCKEHAATTYHLYLAATVIYFARVHHKNEMVIGVPVLNRSGKRYKSTLGMFTVIMPLKITLDTTDTCLSIIKKIVTALRQSYRHARYPASVLGQDLQMIQQGRDRIFDITLSFESTNYSVTYSGAPTSEPRQTIDPSARYPLSIILCEFHDSEPTEFILSASDDFFTARETSLLATRLQSLINNLIAQPNCQYEQLPLLSHEAQNQQIKHKHQNVIDHQNVTAFIDLFQQNVSLNPKQNALMWAEENDDGHQYLTLNYEQLNKQANRLARHLCTLNIKKGDIVAVILQRQPETIAAFLAIAKVGAAFLPLDPTQPINRIEQQMALSQSVIAIESQAYLHTLNQPEITTVVIDDENAPLHNLTIADHDLNIPISENDLAYVLFTSGSTGVPKGVLIEHGALSKRLAWLAKTFEFTPNDIALQSIQLNFDPAIIEICLPLTQGAQIALPGKGKIAPTDLAFLAAKFGATHIIFVPTTLRYFNQTANHYPNLKLRIAISGGEKLPTAMAKAFTDKTKALLYNFYGPTEACIFATTHQYTGQNTDKFVPIGMPVDDTRIYILDKNLGLLPEGEKGEIYIGGTALARGYLNDADLTQSQFINNPFIQNQHLYKTGDLGFWDQNGNLQYVSRIDNQMKLNGQRIASEEIEAALQGVPKIKAAAVKLVNNALQAWIVLASENTLDEAFQQKTIQHISQILPAYMVPKIFNQINQIPQQSSGKTDYKALVPQALDKKSPKLKKPINQLEATLLTFFKSTLQKDEIGTRCHFYQLGADSITSLNLIAKIQQAFGETIPLSILLANPTVETLALRLANTATKNELAISIDLTRKTGPSSKKQSLWIAASGHGDLIRFKSLAQLLSAQFKVQMLQPVSNNKTAKSTTQTIEALAHRYANDIIHHHRHDESFCPIIAGFSVGGLTALETARILISEGIKIKGIVLIDTTYPRFFLCLSWLWRVSAWLVNTLGLQELSINQRQLGTLFSDQGLQTQITALSQYSPKALDTPTTLIISSGFKPWYRYLFKPWQKLQNKNLIEKHLSGFHGTLFDTEHVDALADIFKNITEQNTE
ncbi:non-ribosomal peptide synthetase [Algibacillus agarilyticus]|uniref:non-ribosomal peptide synthetase n=1 Tax=Algibacillus agarilyticus TaxID=2234133 RepID=UPI000DD08879|nr:non-ribosomal peptide synthetase [Algibacillus agarilyticus]